MSKVLVLGASGATGKLVVSELLQRNTEVVAIVRSVSSLVSEFDAQAPYTEIIAEISELSVQGLAAHLRSCDAVISCLGHQLTWRGMFGEPKRLVTETIKKVAQAITLIAPDDKIKIILMNTTGNSNRNIPEQPPFSQKLVVAILRLLLPPHVDNEQAADFLRTSVGQDHHYIEWLAVRPDSLTDENRVSEYEIHPSPIRNPIFDAGSTSRENVANFMAKLAADADLWSRWKGQMPVIYNK